MKKLIAIIASALTLGAFAGQENVPVAFDTSSVPVGTEVNVEADGVVFATASTTGRSLFALLPDGATSYGLKLAGEVSGSLNTDFTKANALPVGWTSKQYNDTNTPHFTFGANGAVLNYAWKQNAIQTAYSIPSTEEVTIDVVTYSSNTDSDVVLFLASTDYSVAIGNSYNSNKEITIGSFDGDASSVFVTFQNNTGTNPDNKVIVAEAGEINVAGPLTYHLVLNGTSLTGTVTDSNSVTKEISFTLPAEYTFTTLGLALDTYNNQAGVKSVSITGGAPIWDGIKFVGEDGASWDVADNWSKGAVPTAEDDVLIDAAKSIVLSTSSVAKSVTVTANATFTGAIDGTKIKGVTLDYDTELTIDVASGVTSEIRNVSGGKIIKTGEGELHFSNDSGSAINGTTIEITEGRAGPYNGNQDAVMTNPTFIIGENGELENKGWLTVNGTLTLESNFDKEVLSNNFGGNRHMAKIGGGTAVVKKGTGTITLCSGSNANYSTLTVEGGKLNFGASVPTVFNGAATAEGVVGVTNSTLQFNGAATLNGGLEVAENRTVTFNSSNASVVKGISGAGTVTMSGSGDLKVGPRTVESVKRSLDGGIIVNINAAVLRLGNEDIGDGSWLGDCTLNFNGGSARAHGWPEIHGTINVIATQDGVMEGSNAGNSTRGQNAEAKIVKTGSGTLQWKSIFRKLPVVIEEGSIDKSVSAHGLADGSTVTLAVQGATFKVSAELADGVVLSGVTGYDVAFDGDTKTYSLVEASAYPKDIAGGSDDQKAAYKAWVTTLAESSITIDPTTAGASEAFALKLTAAKIAAAESVEDAVEDELDALITADMVAELAAKAAEGETTVEIEGFENATFKFVPVEEIETTAKLFRLAVSFKPANNGEEE